MIAGRKKLGQNVVGISAIDKVVARPCGESLVGDWTASPILAGCLVKVTMYPSWKYSGIQTMKNPYLCVQLSYLGGTLDPRLDLTKGKAKRTSE
jgi:hypothetical protein